MAEPVTREEFGMYVKGVNGSLDRIERGIEVLNEKLDRVCADMSEQIETRRIESLESHRRIHERIDNVEKHRISRSAAILISVFSSMAVALITGMLVAFLR